jgi:hypothetical protein
MALYVCHSPSITSPLKGKAKVQAVEDHIKHQHKALKLLKDILVKEKNYHETTSRSTSQ